MKKESELSAESLRKVVRVDAGRWNRIASENDINATKQAVEKSGITVMVVDNGEKALEKISEMIPEGAEVMSGSSTTLIEIGFVDLLKSGNHRWKNVHESIMTETNQAKQADLRRKSLTADYFLASVNAIAKTGELVACDASGSRVGAFPFAAKNLILVSGINKIVPTLNEAMERVREYAFKLEDARAKKVYGVNSRLGKMVILASDFPGRTTLILVKDDLGY